MAYRRRIFELIILTCFTNAAAFSVIGRCSAFRASNLIRLGNSADSSQHVLIRNRVRIFCSAKLDRTDKGEPDNSIDDARALQMRANIEEESMCHAECSDLCPPLLDEDTTRKEYRARTLSDLKANGVVRLNSAISERSASEIRNFVLQELETAKEEVANGMPALNRFSALLSSQNRWDLKLPLMSPLDETLRRLLRPGAPLGDLLESLASADGRVFELAAFITAPGAGRQVVHSDTLWTKTPALFTCTIALQDIDPAMGPTVFMPGTHRRDAHRRFDSNPDELLRTAPHVLSTLSAGDAAVYDSRVLHCGGANRSQQTRALLYLTVCNLNPAGPSAEDDDFWNVASIRPEYFDRLRLSDLRRAAS